MPKAWCERHISFYDVETGCVDCEHMPTPMLPPPPPEKSDPESVELDDDDYDGTGMWPSLLDDLYRMASRDPVGAIFVMHQKFGLSWRGMSELTDLLRDPCCGPQRAIT